MFLIVVEPSFILMLFLEAYPILVLLLEDNIINEIKNKYDNLLNLIKLELAFEHNMVLQIVCMFKIICVIGFILNYIDSKNIIIYSLFF